MILDFVIAAPHLFISAGCAYLRLIEPEILEDNAQRTLAVVIALLCAATALRLLFH